MPSSRLRLTAKSASIAICSARKMSYREPSHGTVARDQEDDQRPGNAAASVHQRGRPNRPQGRTIRITAIRAKTENSEKLGKIRMPNDSTWP